MFTREVGEKMSRRAERRKQREVAQRNRRLAFIAIVAVAAIAIVVILIRQGSPAAFTGSVVVPTPIDAPNVQGTAMGDPNAPVRVDEYSDYQCPYCRQFQENTLPLLAANEIANGQVYFVYHPFSFIGQESRDAANAAYCANDQGKFWEYSETLFANQAGENAGTFSQSMLLALGDALNLDMTSFKTCVSGNQHKAEVDQAYAQGVAAGVKSTPSFVINGKLVLGALPYDQFQAQIQSAMGQPQVSPTP
jgi:protein-disulfide isomerase